MSVGNSGLSLLGSRKQGCSRVSPRCPASTTPTASATLPRVHDGADARSLQAHRLAIGMELVTSELGDHGQRPLQDYGELGTQVAWHCCTDPTAVIASPMDSPDQLLT